jgi:protein-S-isoprenylcysteine O-methyltransferase Ste14
LKITRYQKLFGVGQIAFLIGLIILGLLWLLDRNLGHIAISGRPKPVRIIGAALLIIWLGWHCWCMKAISQWWRHDKLCTSGPYRFVKHPIYAGGIWFGSLGAALIFNSWIILLLPVLFYPVVSLLVRREEAMMNAVFGEQYQNYASQTGRLFPRFFD